MKKINCKSLSLHLFALAFIVIFNFCVMPQLNYAIAVENASQPAGIALGAKVEAPRLGTPVPYEGRKIKTVLCYGDSNTYDADPNDTYGRHPWPICYPGRLQTLLGPGYHVVE